MLSSFGTVVSTVKELAIRGFEVERVVLPYNNECASKFLVDYQLIKSYENIVFLYEIRNCAKYDNPYG